MASPFKHNTAFMRLRKVICLYEFAHSRVDKNAGTIYVAHTSAWKRFVGGASATFIIYLLLLFFVRNALLMFICFASCLLLSVLHMLHTNCQPHQKHCSPMLLQVSRSTISRCLFDCEASCWLRKEQRW